MAIDITTIGLDFIEQYGLIAIFILLVLDGSLLLPVFPGELVLIIAVATYVDDPASLIFMILFTSAAGLVGSLMLYSVCRGGGRKLVERFPGFFMMPKKRRERLEKTFAHPAGQTLVLFLRLFPLTRVLVNIPAGLARMPVIRFVIMSTIGLVAYHAAFLWFTYEARRPGSTIEAQTSQIKEAYASPAWDFVQTNAILTGLAVIVLGIILSVKASRQMARDPDESAGSLVGNLAIAVLFWGGLALAIALYMDPDSVYPFIELGGIDMDAISQELGYSPLIILAATAVVMVLFGAILREMKRYAKRRRQHHIQLQRLREARKREEAMRAAVAKSQQGPQWPRPTHEVEFHISDTVASRARPQDEQEEDEPERDHGQRAAD